MLAVNVAARNARAHINSNEFTQSIKPLTATCPPRGKFNVSFVLLLRVFHVLLITISSL